MNHVLFVPVAVVLQICSTTATEFYPSSWVISISNVVWRECCIYMDGFIVFSLPYTVLLNLAICTEKAPDFYCKHIKSIHTLVAWKYVASCCHPPLCPTHSYCRDCSPAWSSKQHYDIKYSLLLVSSPGLHTTSITGSNDLVPEWSLSYTVTLDGVRQIEEPRGPFL